jgi:hypothetical protein
MILVAQLWQIVIVNLMTTGIRRECYRTAYVSLAHVLHVIWEALPHFRILSFVLGFQWLSEFLSVVSLFVRIFGEP